MIQANTDINSHIKQYLDYYFRLPVPPEFAVLIKGSWGIGKTWFIKDYIRNQKATDENVFYISLYGMTSFVEIEKALFIEFADKLSPELSSVIASKPFALLRKILAPISGKFDSNKDGKDDGTFNFSVFGDDSLFSLITNLDKSILIFDDLERCNIELTHILGYINNLVEHKQLKVIILANEAELLKEKEDNNNEPIEKHTKGKKSKEPEYKKIKEKLIGKTFLVCFDIERALEHFLTIITEKNLIAAEYLSSKSSLIQELYHKAGYENLRTLRQIILDFERIFEVLPEKVKNKPETIDDILKLLIAFSIAIKSGELLPENINALANNYPFTPNLPKLLTQNNTQVMSSSKGHQVSSSDTAENNQQSNTLERLLNKGFEYEFSQLYPSPRWWQDFFDKGLTETDELHESLKYSKYFQNENTPTWRRLWYWSSLSDNDFESLLNKIELEYNNEQFQELGEIKHVLGLLLMFADERLYRKNKQDILNDYKRYIDNLKNNNHPSIMSLQIKPRTFLDFDSYDMLGFQAKEFKEFKEFTSYINEIQESLKPELFRRAAQELLETMANDVWNFYAMICVDNGLNLDGKSQIYARIPILKHIKPKNFIEKLLTMDYLNQRNVFYALQQRYAFNDFNAELLEELEWLKTIQLLLLQEINNKSTKLSGYKLKTLNESFLKEIIAKLEST